MTEDEMTYTEGGGAVGLYVKLSASMAKKSQVVIVGAIVGAFAWVAKGLLAFGLPGSIAWGALSAVVGILAANAVSGLKKGSTLFIGTHVSILPNLTKTVTI
jgi:hypothetical protein